MHDLLKPFFPTHDLYDLFPAGEPLYAPAGGSHGNDAVAPDNGWCRQQEVLVTDQPLNPPSPDHRARSSAGFHEE